MMIPTDRFTKLMWQWQYPKCWFSFPIPIDLIDIILSPLPFSLLQNIYTGTICLVHYYVYSALLFDFSSILFLNCYQNVLNSHSCIQVHCRQGCTLYDGEREAQELQVLALSCSQRLEVDFHLQHITNQTKILKFQKLFQSFSNLVICGSVDRSYPFVLGPSRDVSEHPGCGPNDVVLAFHTQSTHKK